MADAKEKTVKDPGSELVTIRLPLDRHNKDDMYVEVNGRSFLIKRGVEVQVPKYVVEVIQTAEKMQMQAMEYEMAASQRWDAFEKQMGG